MEREKRGNLWTAMAHIVTALIGSSALALAWTFAQLGWVAGPVVLIGFSGVTYCTSAFLADCYRYPDPVTGAPNREFIDAVRCSLGPRKALWCAIVQYANIWATLVGYTVTTTASASAMHKVACAHRKGLVDGSSCSTPGGWGLYLMAAFCAIQVLLSQLPNLESISWISFGSVGSSFVYSSISLGLCIAKWASHGNFRGTLNGATASSPTDKFFNIFLAIGNIATAYAYMDILIEIQDTIKSPPSERKTMKRASLYGLSISTLFYLLLGLAGCAALGNDAPGNILDGVAFHEPFWLVDIANACVVVHFLTAYQVFAQPVFARLEGYVSSQWPGSWFVNANYNVHVPMTSTAAISLTPMKLTLRTAVIVLTTLVAGLLPFFNAVLGLLGAIGFWPLSVYFPVSMHIARLKIRRAQPRWWMLQAMSLCCLLISVGITAASIKDIANNLKKSKPFESN
ncbi:unnamed protein product [Urochloa decumbens]|uniref:Amino acid transporter transmembrane domain-containing protein n=1 Tax=Urochloa decumbens TaxID=240449 RepID=A0ABC8ZI77_9POAL